MIIPKSKAGSLLRAKNGGNRERSRSPSAEEAYNLSRGASAKDSKSTELDCGRIKWVMRTLAGDPRCMEITQEKGPQRSLPELGPRSPQKSALSQPRGSSGPWARGGLLHQSQLRTRNHPSPPRASCRSRASQSHGRCFPA